MLNRFDRAQKVVIGVFALVALIIWGAIVNTALQHFGAYEFYDVYGSKVMMIDPGTQKVVRTVENLENGEEVFVPHFLSSTGHLRIVTMISVDVDAMNVSYKGQQQRLVYEVRYEPMSGLPVVGQKFDGVAFYKAEADLQKYIAQTVYDTYMNTGSKEEVEKALTSLQCCDYKIIKAGLNVYSGWSTMKVFIHH